MGRAMGMGVSWRETLLRVGCAGWTIPPQYAHCFPAQGTHLERYAQRFPAVELNSSFSRPHRPTTYRRWAASVSAAFQFAVKVPKEITHMRRLVDVAAPLARFLEAVQGLGAQLGPLLIQLPPSLPFSAHTAEAFLTLLRHHFGGQVACEPRHRSWFSAEATHLLQAARVARVAADPALRPAAAVPGGWGGLVYYRLHGTPEKYYSTYPPDYLAALAAQLAASAQTAPTWCIFDNTARGAATPNALRILELLTTAHPTAAREWPLRHGGHGATAEDALGQAWGIGRAEEQR